MGLDHVQKGVPKKMPNGEKQENDELLLCNNKVW